MSSKFFAYLFLVGCILGCLTTNYAQDQYKAINIGFYNLENLFDTIDSPNTLDSEFTPLGAKLYNSQVYMDKLSRLESVISKIGKNINPDGVAILGVSEVENRSVLEDLVKQPALAPFNYQIVHYESQDYRGIDVALLYQQKYFKLLDSKIVDLPIYDSEGKKSRTRDILFVTGLMDGDTIHILVNHWPSRRGGQTATEPLRIKGATICAQIKDSLQALNPKVKVLVMGDLNDDPSDKALTQGLKAKAKIDKVGQGDMYNPFYEFFNKGIGTTSYRDAWSLFDQIVLSPGWINDDSYKYYKATVFNERFMIEQSGRYKGYPKRTFSGDKYNYGYSDHFPVFITVIKKQ